MKRYIKLRFLVFFIVFCFCISSVDYIPCFASNTNSNVCYTNAPQNEIAYQTTTPPAINPTPTKTQEVPKINSTSPASGSSNIDINTKVSVSFYDTIKSGDNYKNIFLRDSNGNQIQTSLNISGNILTLSPVSPLNYDTQYTVNVPSYAVQSQDGTSLPDDYTFNFKTNKSTSPLTVASSNPSSDEQDVSLNSPIVINFSSSITSGNGSITVKDGTGSSINFTKSINGQTLTLEMSQNFKSNTVYTVMISKDSINGTDGSSLASDYTFSFASKSIQKLNITSTSPSNSAQNVPVGTQISIKFDSNIKSGPGYSSNRITVTSSKFSWNGNNISSSINVGENSITIIPDNNLDNNTIYTVTVPKDYVTNSDGGCLDSDYTFSFTTEKSKSAPQVNYTSPTSNSSGIDINRPIIITFYNNIQAGNNYDSISLKDSNGYDVQTNLSINSSTLTLTPVSPLKYGTNYSVNIPSGAVQSLDGTPLLSSYGFNFETQDAQKLSVTATSPANFAQNVPVDTKQFSVTFDNNICQTYSGQDVSVSSDKGYDIPCSAYVNGNTISVTPNGDLTNDTTYTIRIPRDYVKNSEGGMLDSDYTFSFTTEKSKVTPKVSSTSPSSYLSYVDVNTKITVSFFDNIQTGRNYNSITLKDSSGCDISKNLSISGNVLTISPVSSLSYGTGYTVEVPYDAVESADGTPLPSSYSFNFQTAEDTSSPRVVSSSPYSGEQSTPISAPITINFSKPVTLNNYIYYDGNKITMKDNFGNNVSFSTSLNGSALTLRPDENLNYNTTYIITIPASTIEDSRYNNMDSNYMLTFTTSVDRTPPVVTSTSPTNSDSNVMLNGIVSFTFSKNIEILNSNSITMSNASVIASTSGNTLIVRPAQTLSPNSIYIVTVSAGAVGDLNGTPTIANYTVEFSTISQNSFNLLTSSPADGETGVDVRPQIVLQFSKELNSNSITPNTVYLLDENGRIVPTKFIATTDDKKIILQPYSDLNENSNYTMVVTQDLYNINNEPFPSQLQWTFATGKKQIQQVKAPNKPTNFTGKSSSSTSIQWTWSDNNNDEDGFIIKDQNGTQIAKINSAYTNVYVEKQLQPGTRYARTICAYKVDSFGNTIESGDSIPANVTTKVFVIQPPVVYARTDEITTDKIIWRVLYRSAESGYKLKVYDSNMTSVGSVNLSDKEYVDYIDINANDKQFSRYFSIYSPTLNSESVPVKVAVTNPYFLPGGKSLNAPLIKVSDDGNGNAVLVIKDKSRDETGFKIYSCDVAGNILNLIESVDSSDVNGINQDTKVTISGLDPSTIYHFVVRAYNSSDEGDNSDPVTFNDDK